MSICFSLPPFGKFSPKKPLYLTHFCTPSDWTIEEVNEVLLNEWGAGGEEDERKKEIQFLRLPELFSLQNCFLDSVF